MKLLAVGLSALLLLGAVLWLAFAEARPDPVPEPVPVPALPADTTPKIPAELLPETRTPKPVPADETTPPAFSVELVAEVAEVELLVGLAPEPESFLGPLTQRRALVTVTTDAGGNARTELALSEARPGDVVFALAVTPGYLQTPAWTEVPDEGSVTLQVQVRRGGTVRGRVLDRRRETVAGARVTLFRDHPTESDELIAIDEVSSNSSGEFALHFAEDGRHDVQAAAHGAGSGSLRDLDFERLDPPQALEVVLDGQGVLAGVLWDPSGKPQRAFELHVVPAALAEPPTPRQQHSEEWSGGLYGDRVKTDREGRFRAAALQPGAYFLMGSTLPNYPPERLHPEPFVTDATDIDLVVGTYRLELRVVDELDRPVEWTADALHRPRLALTELRAFLQESDGAGHPLEPHGFPSSVPDLSDDGTLVFTVRPDRSYLVGAVGPGRLVTGEVFIPRFQHVTSHQLRLPAEREAVALLVRLFGADGDPLAGPCQIYVNDAASGRLLVMSGFAHQEPEWTTSVPPGQVVVRAEAEPAPTHFARTEVARYSPAEATVELFPGVGGEVELRLRGSGRLSITLDVPAPQLDPGFWEQEQIQSYWKLGENLQATFREALGGRALTLTSEADGTLLRPLFEVELPEDSPLHTLDGRWIYPRSPATSVTPLPPGDYLLSVAGLPPVRVSVRDGETTLVTIGG